MMGCKNRQAGYGSHRKQAQARRVAEKASHFNSIAVSNVQKAGPTTKRLPALGWVP